MRNALAATPVVRVALLCVFHGLWLASPANAEVPRLIRYQGTAVDSQKVPLEGPYNLTFRLYDAETAGTKVWEEAHTAVPLAGGQFSVLLGQWTPMTTLDWAVPCWLSIQVNSEPELAPRQRITSVPLALRAQAAEQLVGGDVSARVFNSANISIPDNTSVALPFDSERWDNNGMHETLNSSRLTAKTAGRYLITGQVRWGGPGGAGYRIADIVLNGAANIARVQLPSGGVSDATCLLVTTVQDLAVNDYVELTVMHTQGTTIDVTTSGNFSPEFMMVRLQ